MSTHLNIHWPHAPHVRSVVTYRTGGESPEPFNCFNLATHVGDEPACVTLNRKRLMQATSMPSEPLWLNQSTHSATVIHASDYDPQAPVDGIWTTEPNTVLSILTADCLSLLFYQPSTHAIAACHAGWRGLTQHIIPATLNALPGPASDTWVWVGPCIGEEHFEVDGSVATQLYHSIQGLPPHTGLQTVNLKHIARQQLIHSGVSHYRLDPRCTVNHHTTLFSYRKAQSNITGRFASCIWLAS